MLQFEQSEELKTERLTIKRQPVRDQGQTRKQQIRNMRIIPTKTKAPSRHKNYLHKSLFAIYCIVFYSSYCCISKGDVATNMETTDMSNALGAILPATNAVPSNIGLDPLHCFLIMEKFAAMKSEGMFNSIISEKKGENSVVFSQANSFLVENSYFPSNIIESLKGLDNPYFVELSDNNHNRIFYVFMTISNNVVKVTKKYKKEQNMWIEDEIEKPTESESLPK